MVYVQPSLEFIPPALNPLVLRLTQLLIPVLVRSRTDITQIQADNTQVLAELYHQFQAGKIRLLLAFRHPSPDDPFCMAYLLHRLLPQVARQQQMLLQRPHAHFIYDRGIPLWAGARVAWLFSNLGGIPIHRGKVDRIGLRTARDLLVNGSYPMAVAPEGATNGHGEIVSPLEPGIAQLAFWGVEDLLKAGRSEQVFIVPIGIQYRYIQPPWRLLEKLLSELEVDSGLEKGKERGSIDEAALYQRLYNLGEHLLSLMEEFYTRFYHQTLSIASTNASAADTETAEKMEAKSNGDRDFATRLQALLDAALKVAEQYFNLQPKGSVIERCRRLEQAGWDWIYREDIKQVEALSPVERGLADRIAQEASLRMWHMRLVENFVAVTGKYVRSKPTVERFAETTLLMWETIARIKGSSTVHRPRLGKQAVQMTVGEPISVSDRWQTYQASRRSAKQAVTDLTQHLQIALEQTIQSVP
jgi:1-acyl-sn-glycerol-3-phosphate acyltransferase